MKESFAGTIELTRGGMQPTLNRRGILYTAEAVINPLISMEAVDIDIAPTPTQQASGRGAETAASTNPIFTQEIDTIKNPTVKKIVGRYYSRIESNPLSGWTIGDIGATYLGLKDEIIAFQRTLTHARDDIDPRDLQAQAELSRYASALSHALIAEYKAKGGDPVELFLEVGEKMMQARRIHDTLDDKQRVVDTPQRLEQMAAGQVASYAENLQQPRSVDQDLLDRIEDARDAMDREDYDKLEKAINQLDSGNPNEYRFAIHRMIVEAKAMGKRDFVRFLLEYGLERIINKSDITPKSGFKQPNMYQAQTIEEIQTLGRLEDEELEAQGVVVAPDDLLFQRLVYLNDRRPAIHELGRTLWGPRERYVEAVTSYLKKDGFAFAENFAGVSRIQRMYEGILGVTMALKDSWLSESDYAESDKQVENLLAIERQNGQLKTTYVRNGQAHERDLRPWEITRAKAVGRNLADLSQRRMVWGVYGAKPDNPRVNYESVNYEYIIRSLALFKLIIQRFYSIPIAKRFVKEFLGNIRKGKTYGLKRAGGEEQGVFGKSVEDLAILDTGMVDPKSSEWRNDSAYLDQDDFKTEQVPTHGHGAAGHENVTMLKYLEHADHEAHEHVVAMIKMREGSVRRLSNNPTRQKEEIEKIMHNKQRGVRGINGSFTSYEDIVKREYNNTIRDSMERQRLFLGVLMRKSGLDAQNKAELWRTAAKLNPTVVITLLPNESLDIVARITGNTNNLPEDADQRTQLREQMKGRLREIAQKLVLIEDIRVEEDAREIRAGNRVNRRTIEAYYGNVQLQNRLTPEEQQIVRRIIELGLNNAAADDEGRTIVTTIQNGERNVQYGRYQIDDNGNIATIKQGGTPEIKGGLANVYFPYTAFMNDIPRTAWEKIKEEDMSRLLVGDQSDVLKGLQTAVGFMTNPAIQPEKAMEKFAEMVHAMYPAIGTDAQDRVAVLMKTYFQLGKIKPAAHLFGPFMSWFRIPRSELQQYNMQADLAFDAPDIAANLEKAAQDEVLLDDLMHKDEHGLTQLMKMKKELGAKRWNVFLALFRMFLQALGPVATVEFIKMVLPDEGKKLLAA